MIFLFTHFFLLKQPNLSLHIMYSLHATFPSGKCKIKEGRSHIAIFWAEFHPKYSTIGVLSRPHEMLIYICLYSIKNFAVIDLNFWRLQKYVPCGPSMTPESTVEVSGRFPEVSGQFVIDGPHGRQLELTVLIYILCLFISWLYISTHIYF